jgi:hypothetical protein
MLTTLFTWIADATLLDSLSWCAGGYCAAVLLAVWTVGIVVLVCSNIENRFLLVPVFLAFSGVFGLIVVFAIPLTATVVANAVTFVLFIVSLEVLKKRRSVDAFAFTKHRH